MEKMENEKKRPPVKTLLSKSTIEAMKENNVKIAYVKKKESKQGKYSKYLHLDFFFGFDLLENSIVVRPYIQRRYDIKVNMLETLLYLAPKQYFTKKDYEKMPRQFSFQKIEKLLATGYVSIVQEGLSFNTHLYQVSRKGSEIVRHYYEVLSGEKKIEETSRTCNNKMALVTKSSAIDKRRMALIKQINKLPVSESKKGLFECR